jgi:hypothetical protein
VSRIRSIKPDTWEDEKLGEVSRDARLLFIASWNFADDEGLIRWTALYVKSQIFMYDDDLDEGGVQKLMDELASLRLVFPYVPTGLPRQRLAVIPKFRKHQKINRPTPARLPPPSIHSPDVIEMYARRDGWRCHRCRESIPRRPPVDDLARRLVLDHLVSPAEGGTDYPTNIRAAHLSCVPRGRDAARGDTPPGPLTERFTEPLSEPLSESLTEPLSESLTESLTGSTARSVDDEPHDRDSAEAKFTESLSERVTDSLTAGKEGRGEVQERAGYLPAAPYESDQQRPNDQAKIQRRAPAKISDPDSPAGLVAEWTAADGRHRPAAVLAGIERQIDRLRDEGYSPAQCRVTLRYWAATGLGAAHLPQIMDEMINGPESEVMDPDRKLTYSEIRELIGGITPDPLPDPEAFWIQERAECERLRTRWRDEAINRRAARS